MNQETSLKLRGAFRLLLCAALLALCASLGLAQEVNGSIQGTVKDPSGAVVPNATVTATNTQRSWTATTNEGGIYNFAALPPGIYTVSATGTGFGTVERSNVTVELGRTLQVELTMTVAGATANVNVTANDDPIVDVTSTKTATNITEQQIQALPKTLRFDSVINVAPGTRAETKSGGYQIDGASGSENVFVVDGLEVTRVKEGTLGTTKDLPFDFVREVQVKSAGYEAEFGGATGGVINVVTRSGTNDFHGEARLEVNSNRFNSSARPGRRFNRISLAQGLFVPEYFKDPNGKEPYRLLNPVFDLGGPILKNKLWFYGSYASQFERSFQTLNLISPITAASTQITTLNSRRIEYKTKYDNMMLRLDYTPTSKLSFNVTAINSPIKVTGPPAFLPFETTSTTTFNNSRYPFQGGYTPANQVSGSATYSPLSNLVLSFRMGTTYLNDKGGSYDVPVAALPRIQAPCTTAIVPTGCPAGSTSPGNPIFSTNAAALFDITRRNNFYGDATWNTRIFGQQHTFKGGYQLTKLSNKVDSGQTGPILDFFYGQSEPNSGLDQSGTYGYYEVTDFGTRGQARSRNQAIFAQDQWQIHRRVTLNLGLRTENEFVPAFPFNAEFHPGIDPAALQEIEARGTAPIKFGWKDKLAPRLGAAWNVLGNDKLVIRGSFSIFYDTMKYELPRGSFGADRFIVTDRALNDPDFTHYTSTNLPGAVLAGPFDFRVPSLLTTNGIPPIEPNLKPTKEREYTIASDYAINRDMVFSVRLTRKQLDRTIEDVGLPISSNGVVNEVFFISNPGFGITTTDFVANGLPPTPKAVRNYTGLEFRLDKRFSNNWYTNLSYLYSRLYGNYSGLASTDENGRNSPNVNRFFDLPELQFDSFGKQTLGRLATDRPNTFKAFGAYDFNYRLFGRKMTTEVGGSQFIYQGIPISTQLADLILDTTTGLADGAIVLPNGRGDLGRTPTFTQTDALLTHRFNISERVGFRFTMNVLNLFNQATVTNRSGAYIRGTLAADFNEFNRPAFRAVYSGPSYAQAVQNYLNSNGDWKSRVPASVLNPFYNQPTEFQGPRNIRFSFGVTF
jgi:outer membrane receptor protein involved in Fe transport